MNGDGVFCRCLSFDGVQHTIVTVNAELNVLEVVTVVTTLVMIEVASAATPAGRISTVKVVFSLLTATVPFVMEVLMTRT